MLCCEELRCFKNVQILSAAPSSATCIKEKLFEVEIQYFESPSGNGRGNLCKRKGLVERCWLCDRCAAGMALRLDPQQGLVIVSSNGDGGEVVTRAILQLGPKAARTARVLVRPLDLKLKGAKRREAIELNVTRRLTA